MSGVEPFREPSQTPRPPVRDPYNELVSTRAFENRLSLALAGLPERVVAAYLFGSEARGEASAQSDLDIGILLREPRPPTLKDGGFDLAAALSAGLGRDVDLVVLNGAPVDLAARVLRDGVLLLDRDRSARIGFEVRTRNEYFDLLPYLRQYRAAALARAAEPLP